MATKSQINDLLAKAWASRGKGDYDTSKQLLSQAHKECNNKDFESLGRIYHIYMQHEADNNNISKALKYNKQSIIYYTKALNQYKMAHTIRHRADLLAEFHDNDQSERHYLIALELFRICKEDHDIDVANTVRGYALILEKNKKFKEAMLRWEEARKIYRDFHIQSGIEEADRKLIELKGRMG